jgi:hypothetical protein
MIFNGLLLLARATDCDGVFALPGPAAVDDELLEPHAVRTSTPAVASVPIVIDLRIGSPCSGTVDSRDLPEVIAR